MFYKSIIVIGMSVSRLQLNMGPVNVITLYAVRRSFLPTTYRNIAELIYSFKNFTATKKFYNEVH
jgi:hypothetical protein